MSYANLTEQWAVKMSSPERITSLKESHDQLLVCQKDYLVSVVDCDGSIVREIKAPVNIVYDLVGTADYPIIFGFQGNFAEVWDVRRSLQLLKIDIKGGNRAVRFLHSNDRLALAWANGN